MKPGCVYVLYHHWHHDGTIGLVLSVWGLEVFLPSFWGLFLRQKRRTITETNYQHCFLLWFCCLQSVCIFCYTDYVVFSVVWWRLSINYPINDQQSSSGKQTNSRCCSHRHKEDTFPSHLKATGPPAWPNNHSHHHNSGVAIFPTMLRPRPSQFHTNPLSPVCLKLKPYLGLSRLPPSHRSLGNSIISVATWMCSLKSAMKKLRLYISSILHGWILYNSNIQNLLPKDFLWMSLGCGKLLTSMEIRLLQGGWCLHWGNTGKLMSAFWVSSEPLL